jgi:hypothetical protein
VNVGPRRVSAASFFLPESPGQEIPDLVGGDDLSGRQLRVDRAVRRFHDVRDREGVGIAPDDEARAGCAGGLIGPVRGGVFILPLPP